jgi:hypothetical protein
MAVGKRQIMERPLVYFVGLSAKPDCEHLASETRTGMIIDRIVHNLPSVNSVRTNLVRTPPVDESGKLRYPNLNEMKLGWNELQNEISETSPDLLVALGQQVSVFIRSQMGVQPAKPKLPLNFSYVSYLSQSQSSILSVHHPSFIYVYHRKGIESYIENVVISICTLVFERRGGIIVLTGPTETLLS